MLGKTKEEVKAELAKVRMELDKLEARIDESSTDKAVTDCICNNPGCSGSEPISYALAVTASAAGGVSPW